MDGFCPRALAGAPHMHLQTQRTFHVEQEENLLIFSPSQKYLKPQEWLENQISFNYKKKKKTQPINEHETSELKCTDPSEAGDEESRLEVMFAQ